MTSTREDVVSLPSEWAENLTWSEAKAEPVRLGDDCGSGGVEHEAPRLCGWAGAPRATPKVIAGQGHHQ